MIEPTTDSSDLGQVENKSNEQIFEFIWQFSYDSVFQLSRIDFPFNYGDSLIKKEDWIHDRLFIDLPYTFYLLKGHNFNFHYRGDYGDKSTLSWIYPNDSLMLDYLFERSNGAWTLKEIKTNRLLEKSESGVPYFLLNFFRDSVYQISHIKFPVEINTWTDSPDEDFKDTTFFVQQNDWSYLKAYVEEARFPMLRFNWNSLDIYGSKIILFVGGNANGIHVKYYLEIIDDVWTLIRLEDDSN